MYSTKSHPSVTVDMLGEVGVGITGLCLGRRHQSKRSGVLGSVLINKRNKAYDTDYEIAGEDSTNGSTQNRRRRNSAFENLANMKCPKRSGRTIIYVSNHKIKRSGMNINGFSMNMAKMDLQSILTMKGGLPSLI